jgi:NAD(P)-dependent dehydrogenase (short-subunit alcohol dehydrogenase family)
MTNVADEKNCQELIAYTVKEFGGVHVVVNSAGVLAVGKTKHLIFAGPLVSSKGVLDTKEIMRPMHINVMGTVNVCKFAA